MRGCFRRSRACSCRKRSACSSSAERAGDAECQSMPSLHLCSYRPGATAQYQTHHYTRRHTHTGGCLPVVIEHHLVCLAAEARLLVPSKWSMRRICHNGIRAAVCGIRGIRGMRGVCWPEPTWIDSPPGDCRGWGCSGLQGRGRASRGQGACARSSARAQTGRHVLPNKGWDREWRTS